jgi:hypothetical protein
MFSYRILLVATVLSTVTNTLAHPQLSQRAVSIIICNALNAYPKLTSNLQDKPACVNKHWDFRSMRELGDDWVKTDGPLKFSSEGLVMGMKPPTNFEQYESDKGEIFNVDLGTGFGMNASFHMQFGRVTATMRASTNKGIITNLVAMGDNGDEIDTEFVGGHPDRFESNYFWGEDLIYTVNGGKHAVSSPNGIGDWHEYSINWTPEKLEWYLDGTLVRTRLQSDTCSGRGCVYPTAPA